MTIMDKKQLFDFEAACPPVLNERMLLEEQKRRELKRQMSVLAAAAAFTELCLILLAVLSWTVQPLLSFICMGYVACSACGCGVLAGVCVMRKGEILWQE